MILDIFKNDIKTLDKNQAGEYAYIQIQADLHDITPAQYLENQHIEDVKRENGYILFPTSKHVKLSRWKVLCNVFGSQGYVGGKNGLYIGWGWRTGICKNCGTKYPCTVVGMSSNTILKSGPLLKCDKCGSYRDQTYWHCYNN